MDKQAINLCFPCAEELKVGYDLKVVESGVDRKITCDGCHKRRYGNKYEVTPKNKNASVSSCCVT